MFVKYIVLLACTFFATLGLTCGKKIAPEKLSHILSLAKKADGVTNETVDIVHNSKQGPNFREENYQAIRRSVEADGVFLQEVMNTWNEMGYKDKNLYRKVAKALVDIGNLNQFEMKDIFTKMGSVVDIFDDIEKFKEELIAFLTTNDSFTKE
uniref:Uncharacterized protein n=1 Tax=Clastoptera arizonana TaxID=38151 RepID=A0A1B6DIY2_9HEMI